MDTEQESRPGRAFLLALGVGGMILGALVAAELAVPLQPSLVGVNTTVQSGVVLMGPGVGSDPQLNFIPPNFVLVIGQNSTVTFRNGDSAPHTVTATDHSFDSGNIPQGGQWTHDFTTPGDFPYVCAYHYWMKGTIKVVSP